MVPAWEPAQLVRRGVGALRTKDHRYRQPATASIKDDAKANKEAKRLALEAIQNYPQISANPHPRFEKAKWVRCSENHRGMRRCKLVARKLDFRGTPPASTPQYLASI